jgi:hypothetical protein
MTTKQPATRTHPTRRIPSGQRVRFRPSTGDWICDACGEHHNHARAFDLHHCAAPQEHETHETPE